MTLPAYPATLPALVAPGYTAAPVDPVVRTNGVPGAIRQRERWSEQMDLVDVKVLLSAAEYAVFRGWFANVIAAGAAWFTGPLADESGSISAVRARFVDTWDAESTANLSQQLSFKLEIAPVIGA